jgi:hypothetical protein
MYTAYIGQRIIDLYNEEVRDDEPLSPREFFDEVFFPVFFDHKKYLMWVNNAPFDQAYKQRKNTPLTAEVREEALTKFHEDVNELEEPYNHLYIGGIDGNVTEYTSGQQTNLPLSAEPDEVYATWIGSAAGIGVSSGLSLLIDEDEVLLALLEGWEQCRRFMEQTPNVRAHKVNSWNGWWITHRFGPDYRTDDPLRDLDPKMSKKGKELEFATREWAQVLFTLARQFPKRKPTAYIYNISYRRNTTVGFRPLHLPEIQRLTEWYTHLFGDVEGVRPQALAEVYKAAFSFYRACEQGTIGLKAIEPNKLQQYMPSGRGETKQPSAPSTQNQRTRHYIFQTWIIAMLNNEELLEVAGNAAEALRAHAKSGKRGRATPKRRAEQVLDASNKRGFVEQLTEVLENDGEHAAHFEELVEQVVTMPASDFPLFLTLIKFKYVAADHS